MLTKENPDLEGGHMVINGDLSSRISVCEEQGIYV